METLLVYPDPPLPALSKILDHLGYQYRCASRPDRIAELEPDEGWAGAIVCLVDSNAGAFGFSRAIRKTEEKIAPLLLVADRDQVAGLDLREDLFDDFIVLPLDPSELEVRLKHIFWLAGRGVSAELIEHGALLMNLETYQAAIAGRPLDLTFMEYELLKFLASHPGKVFSRETLLSRVWGYEYYGGARTVDVHIRRLRAKLGEQHEYLIQTVRSVGYRFGKPRWG